MIFKDTFLINWQEKNTETIDVFIFGWGAPGLLPPIHLHVVAFNCSGFTLLPTVAQLWKITILNGHVSSITFLNGKTHCFYGHFQ